MRPPSELTRRFNPRTIVALVMLIVAMILVAITMALIWWSLSGGGTSLDLYLGQGCATGGSPPCQSYSWFTSETGDKSIENVFGLTNILMLVGLILLILALVFFIIAIFFPKAGIGATLCGLIGTILVLVAPIYFFVALPGAANKFDSSINGFFGSTTVSTTAFSWGGSAGWFMAFVAFAISLVATILCLRAVRTIAPMGNIRMSMGPPPAYGPYQQPQAGYPPQYQPYQQAPYPPQQTPYQAPAQYPPAQQPQYGAPQAYPPTQPAPPAYPTPAPAPSAAPAMPAKCPTCGVAIEPGQVFCKSCGTRVG